MSLSIPKREEIKRHFKPKFEGYSPTTLKIIEALETQTGQRILDLLRRKELLAGSIGLEVYFSNPSLYAFIALLGFHTIDQIATYLPHPSEVENKKQSATKPVLQTETENEKIYSNIPQLKTTRTRTRSRIPSNRKNPNKINNFTAEPK
jgi:hypothetical protein